MPRTWVRKTDRGVDAKILKRAAEELTMEHLSGQWQKSMASAMLRLIDIGRSLNFFKIRDPRTFLGLDTTVQTKSSAGSRRIY